MDTTSPEYQKRTLEILEYRKQKWRDANLRLDEEHRRHKAVVTETQNWIQSHLNGIAEIENEMLRWENKDE